jgi:hypothetical protein
MAWMYPVARAAWWVRTHVLKQIYERPKSNHVFVVGWTGMRGVVALAAANSLLLTLNDGSPFPQRNFIIFLTFSLILVTLVVQDLSLPWLVRMLGLSAGNAQFCEEGEARHLLLQAGIDFLGERRKSAKGEHEVHLMKICCTSANRPSRSPSRSYRSMAFASGRITGYCPTSRLYRQVDSPNLSMSSIKRDVKKKVLPRPDAEKIFVSRSSPLPVSVPLDLLERFVLLACLPFPWLSSSGGDDANRVLRLGKRTWYLCVNHGSIRGSWPIAISGYPRRHSVTQ